MSQAPLNSSLLVTPHSAPSPANALKVASACFRAVPERFAAQALRSPDAIALVSETETLTYSQLNQRTNQLARYLKQHKIGAGDRVAVHLRRSPATVIAFLAVLKSGAAYVPIDPDYPDARRNYILQDASVALLLSESSLVNQLSPAEASLSACLCLDTDWDAIARFSDDNLPLAIQPNDIAYLIYTSGSTGKPKGVLIDHLAMLNHNLAMADIFELSPADRTLQFASLGFDVAIEEIYPTLISGASLILFDQAAMDCVQSFFHFVAAHRITVLNLPAAFWQMLVTAAHDLHQNWPDTLRLMVVGSEKVARKSYMQWLEQVTPDVRWLNAYGLTESAVSATVFDPWQSDYQPLTEEVPIGKPIANMQAYVLSELSGGELQPVPVGEVGELYLGGLGIAQGYLNMPERTAQRFIASPFEPQKRLFKTGDLVRQRPDGNLEFVGRIDLQVKLRGYRIELSEIEACIESHPLVTQQIVVAREMAGEKQLIAYVVPQASASAQSVLPGAAVESAKLAEALTAYTRDRLPNYMVPTAFVCLKALPTTVNGKIDHQALPMPIKHSTAADTLKTLTEKKLARLWKLVLALDSVEADDNFFELGGNSLKAVHLCSLITEEFDQKLPITALLHAPTIQQLATTLDQSDSEVLWESLCNSLVPLRPNGTTPPLFFMHAVGPSILSYNNLLPYLDPQQRVYALQSKGLVEQEPIVNSVEQMASSYIQDIQKIQPHGPYYLAGHSFGGIMAFEMAQQLQRQGETVGLLGLFDSEIPALSYLQTPPLVYQLYIHVLNFYSAQSWAEKWQYLAERVRPLWRRRVKSGSIAVDPQLELYRRIEKTDREALKRYSPQVYGGKMTLFRVQQKDPKYFYDPYLGWQNLIEGKLEIHTVPGNHISIMHAPHVKTLAVTLQQCLNRAYREWNGSAKPMTKKAIPLTKGYGLRWNS
jgi:amino acid adenylation domain-containing protein